MWITLTLPSLIATSRNNDVHTNTHKQFQPTKKGWWKKYLKIHEKKDIKEKINFYLWKDLKKK